MSHGRGIEWPKTAATCIACLLLLAGATAAAPLGAQEARPLAQDGTAVPPVHPAKRFFGPSFLVSMPPDPSGARSHDRRLLMPRDAPIPLPVPPHDGEGFPTGEVVGAAVLAG